eukprot:ANDGO_00431.mRNA.1 Cilia- and flagella-associated protein 44
MSLSPQQQLTIIRSLGFDPDRRFSIVPLDESTFILPAGHGLFLVSLLGASAGASASATYVALPQIPRASGVVCAALSPDNMVIALGLRGQSPPILLIDKRDLVSTQTVTVRASLPEGTERSYASLAFSPDGTLLASVGSAPDYLITVWNVATASTLLRAKAFGQEVFRVAFAPAELPGVLTTSGSGHIRFWKMARTFTGLKLQGAVGKFGKIEISDVAGFVQLPDSKVVSGSESGSLLIWDDGHVKATIRAHDQGAMVEFVHLTQVNGRRVILSAGHDGRIRVWNADVIDMAEVDDEEKPFEMNWMSSVRFLRESLFDKHQQVPVLIRSVSILGVAGDGKHRIAIVDGNGALVHASVDFSENSEEQIVVVDTIQSSHGQGAACFGVFDGDVFLSGGRDNVVSVYLPKVSRGSAEGSLRSLRFLGSGGLTCIARSVFRSVPCVLAGFGDGHVRIFSVANSVVTLLAVSRPLSSPVNFILPIPERDVVIVAGDKRIFVLRTSPRPQEGSFQLPSEAGKPKTSGQPSSFGLFPLGFFDWDTSVVSLGAGRTPSDILIGTKSTIVEIRLPSESAVPSEDLRESYRLALGASVPYRFRTSLPPKQSEKLPSNDAASEAPKSGDASAEDVIPEADVMVTEDIIQLHRLSSGKIFVALASTGIVEYSGSHFHSNVTEVPFEYFAKLIFSMPNITRFTVDEERSVVVVHTLLSTFIFSYATGSLVASFSVHDSPTVGCSISPSGLYVYSVASSGHLAVMSLQSSFEPSQQIPPFIDEGGMKANIDNLLNGRVVEDVECKYDMEEEKLKAEAEAQRSAAEKRKDAMRKKIAELRQFFVSLKLKGGSGIADDVWESVDPELTETLRRKFGRRLECLEKELALEMEESTLKLNKVKSIMLDSLEVERVRVKSFSYDLLYYFSSSKRWSVSSFRTPKLPPIVIQELEKVHNWLSEHAAKPRMDSPTHDSIDDDDVQSHGQNDVKEEDLPIEERKARRRERWADLMKRKPDEHWEDPRDVAAIAWAETHMGDYPLKLDPAYTVPEHARVNADKKRRQILLLLESIYSLRVEFNERLFAMRDLKKRMIPSLQKDARRLTEIEHALKSLTQPSSYALKNKPVGSLASKREAKAGSRSSRSSLSAMSDESACRVEGATVQKIGDYWYTPKLADLFLELDLDQEEVPEEKRYEYDASTLAEFEKSMKEEKERADREKRAKAAGGFGGFGGGGSGGDSGHSAPQASGATQVPQSGADSKAEKQAASAEPVDKLEREYLARVAAIPPSPVEEHEIRMREESLRHERFRLIRKICKACEAFDRALAELAEEKLRLEADLKSTDSKLLLLAQELQLLSEFEKRDVSLIQRLDGKRKEKSEIVSRIVSCQDRLASKKVEIETLLDKERTLMSEFASLVPQGSEMYDGLLKLFKKKVKRRAPAKSEDAGSKDSRDRDGDDDEDDDEDMDADDYEDMDEEEEEEENSEEDAVLAKLGPVVDADGRPENVAVDVWSKLIDLRERRMDQEDELVEFQKSLDVLKKENDGLVTKEKVADSSLKLIEKEIQDFQNEKQRKLNELFMVVPLRIHQFVNLVPVHSSLLHNSLSDSTLADSQLLQQQLRGENEGGDDDDAGGDSFDFALSEDYLATSVVFSTSQWEGLDKRIQEVQREKNDLRRLIKDLRKDSQGLVKTLKDREEVVFQLDAKMYEAQVLKFGRQVDLDALESAAVDPKSEELKDELQVVEQSAQGESAELDKHIYELKALVAKLTDEQTKKLQVLATQREELYRMEQSLNQASRSSVSKAKGQTDNHKEERDELKERVVDQAREIDALKQEILILRRKGGHVYAPVGV